MVDHDTTGRWMPDPYRPATPVSEPPREQREPAPVICNHGILKGYCEKCTPLAAPPTSTAGAAPDAAYCERCEKVHRPWPTEGCARPSVAEGTPPGVPDWENLKGLVDEAMLARDGIYKPGTEDAINAAYKAEDALLSAIRYLTERAEKAERERDYALGQLGHATVDLQAARADTTRLPEENAGLRRELHSYRQLAEEVLYQVGQEGRSNAAIVQAIREAIDAARLTPDTRTPERETE